MLPSTLAIAPRLGKGPSRKHEEPRDRGSRPPCSHSLTPAMSGFAALEGPFEWRVEVFGPVHSIGCVVTILVKLRREMGRSRTQKGNASSWALCQGIHGTRSVHRETHKKTNILPPNFDTYPCQADKPCSLSSVLVHLVSCAFRQ